LVNQLTNGTIEQLVFDLVPAQLESVAIADRLVHVEKLIADEGQSKNRNAMIDGFLRAQ
jgi:hypothetical protein